MFSLLSVQRKIFMLIKPHRWFCLGLICIAARSVQGPAVPMEQCLPVPASANRTVSPALQRYASGDFSCPVSLIPKSFQRRFTKLVSFPPNLPSAALVTKR